MNATEPKDPLKFDFGTGFMAMPDRLEGEREERKALGSRVLSFHHQFLDDQLRAITPHDLILIGAESGAGKTELVTGIAKNLARQGKNVFMFALEAEPREIERRIKFSVISKIASRMNLPGFDDLNYPDWMIGRCDDIVSCIEDEADREVKADYGTLRTYYRGSKFGSDEIRRLFLAVQSQADLIILDHLHYVDTDDENENRGFKNNMKLLRDLSLGMGKPIILVAHLRKSDRQAARLVPTRDDFHGSSDIAKICTKAVLISSSRNKDHVEKHWCSPTYVYVAKDRTGGENGFVALCQFDRIKREYTRNYTLGRLSPDGKKWTQLNTGPGGTETPPRWAKHHQRMEIPDAS